MGKVIVAIIEQTIRKQVPVEDDMPVGPFSVDAIQILNALNQEDHSTLIRQKFLSAEVVEVSSDGH